jgi:galactokinase
VPNQRTVTSVCLCASRLHACLSHPSLQPLIWGGKGIGSQGDGTAQLLAKGPGEQARLCALVEGELHMGAMPLTVEVLDQ